MSVDGATLPGPTQDLGTIDGPLLLFGGPYSNLEATQAVLAAAADHDIPTDRVICTGDVVAYCGDPEATTTLVREAGIHVVMGNCEESFASDADDCGCGFAEDSACDVLSRQWYAYALSQLTPGSCRWMGTLPGQIRFRLAGRQFAVIHGGARLINRFLFASHGDDVLCDECDAIDAEAVIAGHCGLPFTRQVGDRLWHNPGVVGMPANDGTPRAWYSILRPMAEGVHLEHHALDYDHAIAAAKMRARGLPEGYAQALETGLWPNTDILPEAETAATGQAIQAGEYTWRQPRDLAAAS